MVRNAVRRRPTISALRIGHFTSRYPIVSHTFIAREVRELRALGAEVHTFTVRLPDELRALSPADRAEASTTSPLRPVSPLRLLRLHARALASSPRAYLSTLRRALALRGPGPRGALWQLFYFAQAIPFAALCTERELAHVHVHHANVAADITLLAAHYGRLAQSLPRSWSLTIHGPTEFDDAATYRPAEKARDADLVFTISDYGRRRLLELSGDDPPARVEVARLGVELERLPYREPRVEADTLRVLNVAQLVARKGQADLLQAIARVDEAELTLVGDGEDRARLESLARELGISERVHFRGALGQDDALAAYRDADAFCLTSYAEGLPVVLMEAMASGVAVVATDVAAVTELVVDEQTGIVIEPGDIDAAATALTRLASDADLRQRLARAARTRVEAGYDLHASVRRLYELLGPFAAD